MRTLTALILFTLPLLAEGPEALKRFRAAYKSAPGPEARRTAILELAACDSPDAAEALVSLYLGHDRDVARLGRELRQLRAKRRDVAQRARDSRIDARQRAALRGKLATLDAIDGAKNKDLAGFELDQSAILDGVKEMRDEKTMEWFAREGIARAKSPLLLQALAARVAASGRSGVSTLVVALGKVNQPERVVPLLQALGRHGDEIGPGLPVLLRFLGHKDWTVRVAAAYALARAAQPEGVGPLVQQLQVEAPDSRAQREIARALAILANEKIGNHPELWLRWWKAHRDAVMGGKRELGRGKPDGSEKTDQGRFYGIPQRARRIIYVFDISGSMEVSMNNPRWIEGSPIPARDDEDRRFDAALRELLNATKRLKRGTLFTVVLYSNHARSLHERLVETTPEVHAKLAADLEHVGPEGATNIYEALEYALRLAHVHPDARGEQQADAIYLLSDGSPTDAQGKTENPDRTLRAVREWNALGKVAIHTIGIGKQHNSSFLQVLAEQNGGEYYSVVPKRKRKR